MEVNLIITGKTVSGCKDVFLSFTVNFDDGRQIEINYDGPSEPVYKILREHVALKLMREQKMSRAQALGLINEGLSSCGLSIMFISNAALVG